MSTAESAPNTSSWKSSPSLAPTSGTPVSRGQLFIHNHTIHGFTIDQHGTWILGRAWTLKLFTQKTFGYWILPWQMLACLIRQVVRMLDIANRKHPWVDNGDYQPYTKPGNIVLYVTRKTHIIHTRNRTKQKGLENSKYNYSLTYKNLWCNGRSRGSYCIVALLKRIVKPRRHYHGSLVLCAPASLYY